MCEVWVCGGYRIVMCGWMDGYVDRRFIPLDSPLCPFYRDVLLLPLIYVGFT